MKKIDPAKTVKVTNNRYRLSYHVSTPFGWMNDPNGFVYYKGYYHVFYQYHPYSAEWGPMHWGHCRSKDLVHWEELPVALVPGDPEDKDGCFSGSAIEKDGRLYLIYTGHHYYGDGDQDHFWQTQNIAYSDDGIHFTKYEHNPVIALPPKDNSQHFRDPKVWQHGNEYYVILGSQATTDGVGRVITYKSKDLLHWDYLGPIAHSQGVEQEGYMWECPDFFKLNGKDILLCSPQGIKATAKKYLNKYETGYFVGQFDYDKNKFTHGGFTELDHGHDFYATQTTLTPDGRRIVLGWLDMWDSKMPEQADGWAGALTLPRELTLKDNHLYMKPIKELTSLRQEQVLNENQTITEEKLVVPDPQHLELNLVADVAEQAKQVVTFALKNGANNVVSLTWNQETGEVVVERPDKEAGDIKRFGQLKDNSQLKLQAFIDTSSIEFFLNDGELVFSERYYTEDKLGLTLSAKQPLKAEITGYTLGR